MKKIYNSNFSVCNVALHKTNTPEMKKRTKGEGKEQIRRREVKKGREIS